MKKKQTNKQTAYVSHVDSHPRDSSVLLDDVSRQLAGVGAGLELHAVLRRHLDAGIVKQTLNQIDVEERRRNNNG
jgi:hypothetical protein